MARILRRDNFGRSGEQPGFDENFLLWPMEAKYAAKIVEILQEESGGLDSSSYYVVADNDHELIKFEI